MKVLLLADPAFASTEHALLRRLAAGLADEGVRVLSAVPYDDLPEGVSYGSRLGVFATDVGYAPTGLPLTTPRRARDLLAKVTGGTSPERLDLVHAWGQSQWEIAWAVAQAASCPMLLEVWDWPSARAAVSFVTRLARLGRAVGTIRLSAADTELAAALTALLPPAAQGMVHACPWGVHLAEHTAEHTAEGSATAPEGNDRTGGTRVLALWPGPATDGARTPVRALLQALAARPSRSGPSGEGLLLVMDQASAQQTGAWADARKLNITEWISVVPGHLTQWDALLDTAAVILTGAQGEQAGLVLDAMAASVPIIARADARVSFLSAAHTPACAQLVTSDDSAAWSAALAAVLDDPARAASLGQAARALIERERLGFHHVTAVVRLYDQLALLRGVAS